MGLVEGEGLLQDQAAIISVPKLQNGGKNRWQEITMMIILIRVQRGTERKTPEEKGKQQAQGLCPV